MGRLLFGIGVVLFSLQWVSLDAGAESNPPAMEAPRKAPLAPCKCNMRMNPKKIGPESYNISISETRKVYSIMRFPNNQCYQLTCRSEGPFQELARKIGEGNPETTAVLEKIKDPYTRKRTLAKLLSNQAITPSPACKMWLSQDEEYLYSADPIPVLVACPSALRTIR